MPRVDATREIVRLLALRGNNAIAPNLNGDACDEAVV
jgi:hypothetical protein